MLALLGGSKRRNTLRPVEKSKVCVVLQAQKTTYEPSIICFIWRLDTTGFYLTLTMAMACGRATKSYNKLRDERNKSHGEFRQVLAMDVENLPSPVRVEMKVHWLNRHSWILGGRALSLGQNPPQES